MQFLAAGCYKTKRGCFAVDFDAHCIKINAKTGAFTSALIQKLYQSPRKSRGNDYKADTIAR